MKWLLLSGTLLIASIHQAHQAKWPQPAESIPIPTVEITHIECPGSFEVWWNKGKPFCVRRA